MFRGDIMNVRRTVAPLALSLLLSVPVGVAAQSVLMQAKTSAGNEVATIRTDSMRLLVPLHLLVGGLLFPDGTVQTTAAGGTTSVTSADIVDGTIVNADISASAVIADTKLATISTAGKVSNSATTATSSNTVSTIVARDGSGGFSAGYAALGDSLRVGGEGSFVAAGTFQSGTTAPAPASGAGTRMMWYPEKGAFRAGVVNGTQWDAANVGVHSLAAGSNTTASGMFSTALGNFTTASGAYATALGDQSTASGNYATALGGSSTASGNYATALSSGDAIGAYSTAMGLGSTAPGDHSVAGGYYAYANGANAIAFGTSLNAGADYSTVFGSNATANSQTSLVIGRYNVISGTPGSWVSTDPLFVAGNGSGNSTPSNALTLYKNGNLTIAGTLTQSSDARLKEDMEPLEGTLAKVLQLTPIRYRFRPGTGRPSGEQIGLTAQQVEPLFPELVKQDGDGYLSLSYANLSAVLVKAVQEQQAEIAPLQAKIRTLQDRNDELESTLRATRSQLARLQASQSEILRRLRVLEAGGSR
jgi:hypothetical protein